MWPLQKLTFNDLPQQYNNKIGFLFLQFNLLQREKRVHFLFSTIKLALTFIIVMHLIETCFTSLAYFTWVVGELLIRCAVALKMHIYHVIPRNVVSCNLFRIVVATYNYTRMEDSTYYCLLLITD